MENSKKEDYKYIFIFMTIGDSAVGKTSIITRFVQGKIKQIHEATVGQDLFIKIIPVSQQQNIKLQIWDTTGQENYKSIGSAYYKNKAGVILVYDISSRESFENAQSWLNEARVQCPRQVQVILVGNKLDKEEQREVTQKEAQSFADQEGLLFVEVSAQTGENIDQIFFSLAKQIQEKINSEQIEVLDEYGIRTNFKQNRQSLLLTSNGGGQNVQRQGGCGC